VNADDRVKALSAFESRRANLNSTYTVQMLHCNGSILDVEITGYPRFVGEEFLGSVAVMTNLTERARREHEIVESNGRYQTLLENAQANAKRFLLIDEIRVAAAKTKSSQELIRTVVESIHTVLGFQMVSIYLLEQQELVLQHAIGYDQVITHFPMTGQGVMVRTTRDNRLMLIADAQSDPDFQYPMAGVRSEVCVPITAHGQVLGVINLEEMFVDAFNQTDAQLLLEVADRISHHLEMTRALDRLRILENAVKSSDDFILITDANLELPGPKIVYVNQALLRQTGYSSAELEGQTPRILQGAQSDKVMLAELKLALKQGQPFKGKTVNYRKDGSPFSVEWDISPVLDEQQQVTHFVSMQRDISERVRLEALLESLIHSLHPNYRLTKEDNVFKALEDNLIALQQQLDEDDTIRGQLEGLGGASTILQMIAVSHAQGALHLQSKRVKGTLYLQNGRIVTVEHPELSLKAAVLDLLKLKRGSFQFDPYHHTQKIEFDLDPTGLLLELAQFQDENPNVSIGDSVHRVVLPQLSSARAFMEGVGGEMLFTAAMKTHLGWRSEKLTFFGRGFMLVVLEGNLQDLPEDVLFAIGN
jgi:PAS domain S-box-containing protein